MKKYAFSLLSCLIAATSSALHASKITDWPNDPHEDFIRALPQALIGACYRELNPSSNYGNQFSMQTTETIGSHQLKLVCKLVAIKGTDGKTYFQLTKDRINENYTEHKTFGSREIYPGNAPITNGNKEYKGSITKLPTMFDIPRELSIFELGNFIMELLNSPNTLEKPLIQNKNIPYELFFNELIKTYQYYGYKPQPFGEKAVYLYDLVNGSESKYTSVYHLVLKESQLHYYLIETMTDFSDNDQNYNLSSIIEKYSEQLSILPTKENYVLGKNKSTKTLFESFVEFMKCQKN